MKQIWWGWAACIVWMSGAVAHAAPACGERGVYLQVLGSGGPELTDQRASSGYLVWQDGRARLLVDIGPGSMLRYEQSGARIEDLDAILLTHLHVDHAGDLPALLKASYFTDRARDLALYGPTGNGLMPDTVSYVKSLFSEPAGAFRYLAGYLSGDEAFRVVSHNVSAEGKAVRRVVEGKEMRASAVPVRHGPIPALAWRIEIGGRVLVFSGDMSGDLGTLPRLAAGADVLVAHHAIPEGAKGAARNLHMPPSVIGEIAAVAKVERLVLSHRMQRTLGREQESEREVRRRYRGPLDFAEDGQCFGLER